MWENRHPYGKERKFHTSCGVISASIFLCKNRKFQNSSWKISAQGLICEAYKIPYFMKDIDDEIFMFPKVIYCDILHKIYT